MASNIDVPHSEAHAAYGNSSTTFTSVFTFTFKCWVRSQRSGNEEMSNLSK